MASHLFPTTRMMPTPNLSLASSSSHPRTSLSTGFLSPVVGGSVLSEFSGTKIRPPSLNPSLKSTHKPKRGVVTMVIPFSKESRWKRPPPDLASYLFRSRIVYLGMCLIPAVTELMLAEFLYLQYVNRTKPIYFYINSTGTTKGDKKLGYETEALSIYDSMSYVKPRVYTLCVGYAWGEASMLLAAGDKGHRAALPSSTIMMRQPMARFQGQASDVDIMRKAVGSLKEELVKIYAKHTGKSAEEIEKDIERPKYFTPSEAVEYGIIDKVLYTEKSHEDSGVLADIKRSELI